MNANEFANILQNQIDKSIDNLKTKTYKRGIVAAVDGQYVNVYIEGSTVAHPKIICVDSYRPKVGDKVLILSIGVSGTNLVVLGSINGEVSKPSMFTAYKTSSQTAVTDNALTSISWNSVQEFNANGNFNVANNRWVAPSDGWLECQALIAIDGGTDQDDTMSWGFYKNGAAAMRHADNWRKFSTAPGVEYPSVAIGAFKVKKGDVIDVRYMGTSYAVTILGASSEPGVFIGKFTPNTVWN